MRSVELLGCTVYDADGRALGSVRDLHFQAVHDPTSGVLVGYRLDALECGDVALGHRLGYGREYMVGPALLQALFRPLRRRSFLVKWADVTRVERPRVETRLRPEEFDRR